MDETRAFIPAGRGGSMALVLLVGGLNPCGGDPLVLLVGGLGSCAGDAPVAGGGGGGGRGGSWATTPAMLSGCVEGLGLRESATQWNDKAKTKVHQQTLCEFPTLHIIRIHSSLFPLYLPGMRVSHETPLVCCGFASFDNSSAAGSV